MAIKRVGEQWLRRETRIDTAKEFSNARDTKQVRGHNYVNYTFTTSSSRHHVRESIITRYRLPFGLNRAAAEFSYFAAFAIETRLETSCDVLSCDIVSVARRVETTVTSAYCQGLITHTRSPRNRVLGAYTLLDTWPGLTADTPVETIATNGRRRFGTIPFCSTYGRMNRSQSAYADRKWSGKRTTTNTGKRPNSIRFRRAFGGFRTDVCSDRI